MAADAESEISRLAPEVIALIGAAARVVVYCERRGSRRDVPAHLIDDLGRALQSFPPPPYGEAR